MTFALQLVDGKYVNFEDFVTNVVDANGNVNGSCKTLANYKSSCVNGSNSSRRYVSNAMLQAAFARARELDAVGVYLPRGVWNFNEQVVVPHGMTLKGNYDRPHNVTESDLHVVGSGIDWNETRGTNIACYSGWGHAPFTQNPDVFERDTEACIALQGTATLDGVNVFYPQQNRPSPNSSFTPVKYPWTISCQPGVGSIDYLARCAVMNTTLVNSYAGIDLNFGVDHYIRGVNMTALKIGIRVDNVTSQGSIEDINMHAQFSAYYYGMGGFLAGEGTALAAYNHLEAYLVNNMTGLDFGWVDWGWLKNVFIFKAYRGFYFRRGKQGYNRPNIAGHFRAAASLDIQNSGCDNCTDALYVEEVNSGVGVNFANTALSGRIYVSDDNHGAIRIANSYLEFDAGGYGKQVSGNVNYYNRNHVEIGKATTMQISNTEILDFMGDQPKGLWKGSTFDVKGNLILSNSSLVWPMLGAGFDGTAQSFTARTGSVIGLSNTLIRGIGSFRLAVPTGDSPRAFTEYNTLFDPMEFGYHPSVKTSGGYSNIQ
ncbi:MAG: hypothetical protein II565_03120 [Fibrobacter sp.]|nr:hypothetical protein [Fibrobacter sp.]